MTLRRIRIPAVRRRRLLIVALVLLVLGLIPAVSYAQALTKSGAATLSVRTVDWLRDQGLSPVVNAVENWYYSRHAPSDAAPQPQVLPAPPQNRLPHITVAPAQRPAAALPVLAGRQRLPGEATWYPHRPGVLGVLGVPTVYTGFFRPDPQHRSVVAGVAWIRTTAVTAHLVAGTVEPGGRLAGKAAIPRADVPALVATFNSGWRLKDIHGGFFLHARSAPALISGQATAAIDAAGRLRVGQWGRDLHLADQLVAARQNLALVVDHNQLAAGLDANAAGQWGSPKNQFQYTGRSGLGVDPRGNVLYIAGNNLTLHTLASALLDAGAVTGMELDIHNGMQSFSTWEPGTHATLTPTRLLPTMTPPADRYLKPDQRDFFYVTTRSPL